VTWCIVEVLSNALAKPNAPPINPECKEILKKSGRNDRERSENEQLEARYLKDAAETEKHHAGSMEKEQSQAEGEPKKYVKGSDGEKLVHEDGKSKEGEAGHHSPIQDERLHTEEQKHSQEIGTADKKNYHSEEESKENKCCDGNVEHDIRNKKLHSAGTNTEEFRDGNDHHPMGHWHLEEEMQNPYKQIHETEEGEAEEERSEKYHHQSKEQDLSSQKEHKESDESEETKEEKQPYKPRHYHEKHRVGDSYEEKRGHSGEKEELAKESDTEEAYLWDQWNRHQKHHEESEQQREEESGYHGRHGTEEVKTRLADQGSEDYRDRWHQSEESHEEKRHQHSEESNEKLHEERRRHYDGSHEGRRHHSEGRMYPADEREEDLDRYLRSDSKEKQHHAGGRYHLWNNEEEGSQKAYAGEDKGQARRHYSIDDNVEQRHYPSNSEEEEEDKEVEKHHSSDQVENEEKERYAEREEHISPLPVENKRTYSPFYPLQWWKSQLFEKRDSAREQLLAGKEEGKPTLNEKILFPEYNNYDWWEEKQILSALKHRHTKKRNLGKISRYDMKRQNNKMDQLAQLLNYRKKSAEFPELYSSEEDLEKRYLIDNDRRSLSQRPLTEDKEKALENLAIMDLELQKIAEKFNNLRRG
ncbi:PREDICTED: secretogranin-1, partial [Acanthisitta chloris]